MSGYYPGYNERAGGGVVFVLFVVGIILTICLYFVKTRAQTAKSEVIKLERIVAEEHAAVKVLKAELAHLESPVRLSALSKRELNLKPISVDQLATIQNIGEIFPLKAGTPELTSNMEQGGVVNHKRENGQAGGKP